MATPKSTELPPEVNLDDARRLAAEGQTQKEDSLVNENRDLKIQVNKLLGDLGAAEALKDKAEKNYTSAVQTLNNVKGELREAKEKIAKAGYAPEARQYRLFLELVQGFAARGSFDQEALAKKGAQGADLHLVSLFNHIAGLTEVGYRAIGTRF